MDVNSGVLSTTFSARAAIGVEHGTISNWNNLVGAWVGAVLMRRVSGDTIGFRPEGFVKDYRTVGVRPCDVEHCGGFGEISMKNTPSGRRVFLISVCDPINACKRRC